MKKIIIILLLYQQLPASSQNTEKRMSNSVSGTVYIPALQSINVQTLFNGPVYFTSLNDYNNGKIIPNYCLIDVASNVPWMVSVLSNSPHLASDNNTNMPVSILKMKARNANNFMDINNTPQALLMNENNRIKNQYSIDLKIDPSWSFPGGNYTATLTFTLTQQ